MLKLDIRRALLSPGMLAALVVGLILVIEPMFGGFGSKALLQGDYLNFLFSCLALGGFLIFTPMITVLPCIIPFCDEYNTRYYQSVLLRAGKKKYLRNRLVSNAISGGLATFLPLFAATILMIAFCEPTMLVRGSHLSRPEDQS